MPNGDDRSDDHQPLADLPRGAVTTAGRLAMRTGGWHLINASVAVPLALDGITAPEDPARWRGALARVRGNYDGTELAVERLELVGRARGPGERLERQRRRPLDQALALRDQANRQIRAYFTAGGFTEVDTPALVAAPGTDIYLAPVAARPTDPATDQPLRRWLHTSPEFAMKRLLAAGCERIYQLAKVWRDGEASRLHHREFTILEWYRAWEPLEAIMADVENVVAAVCEDVARVAHAADEAQVDTIGLEPPFERLTMREVVRAACGFELYRALDFDGLFAAAADRGLLSQRRLDAVAERGRWDELFFELQVTHLDPWLATRGAVFVTEWPAQLAVLARKKPDDPRVAERFELYVGGVELANGFDELTDPDEQRARFEHDLAERRKLGLEPLPMPDRLLEAMAWGLPPSAGVALGVDRLLMVACGAGHIREVLPFAPPTRLAPGEA